jgi:hypothetical protein
VHQPERKKEHRKKKYLVKKEQYHSVNGLFACTCGVVHKQANKRCVRKNFVKASTA